MLATLGRKPRIGICMSELRDEKSVRSGARASPWSCCRLSLPPDFAAPLGNTRSCGRSVADRCHQVEPVRLSSVAASFESRKARPGFADGDADFGAAGGRAISLLARLVWTLVDKFAPGLCRAFGRVRAADGILVHGVAAVFDPISWRR